MRDEKPSAEGGVWRIMSPREKDDQPVPGEESEFEFETARVDDIRDDGGQKLYRYVPLSIILCSVVDTASSTPCRVFA
jgi:hypothetical protein